MRQTLLAIALLLELAANCGAAPVHVERSWQHSARLDAPAALLPLGIGCAVAANDLGWIAVGAGVDQDTGFDSGAAALWRVIDGAIRFEQVVTHPRASRTSAFGAAVTFDALGRRLCIGAPCDAGGGEWPENFQMGRVFVYAQRARLPSPTTSHTVQEWILEASLASDSPLAAGHFGAAIHIANERIIVGSPAHSGRGGAAGRAEIFVRTPRGWKFEAELVPATAMIGARFGTSVALHTRQDGVDLALVGSPNFLGVGFSSGCADLFRRDRDGWRHLTRLSSPHPQSGGLFGMCVAINDELIAVGAPQETPQESQAFPERAGVVHLFSCTNAGTCDSWGATATVTSLQPWCGSTQARSEAFGMSLALTSRRMVVGASEACGLTTLNGGEGVLEGQGAAYCYERIAPALWRAESRLTAPTPLAEVHDGYRVAIGSARGDPFIVTGRLGNFDQPVGPGEANVFALTAPLVSAADSASREPPATAAHFHTARNRP
ncbi:MAG: hypothetical protein EXS17_08265 [Phycisphaerales bacterium]|nr:hypothetical protein [Phycisphaerales bacterium]